jgi:hypothetical protein
MNIRINIAVSVLVVAGAFSVAHAQDRPEDYARMLKSDCSKEIRTQCKGLVEGRGRLLACLYSHENKLTPKCSATVYGSLERLGMMLGAIANVTRICEVDARRLCSGVKPGDGNLINCLSKARASVSAQCNTTLDTAFLRP